MIHRASSSMTSHPLQKFWRVALVALALFAAAGCTLPTAGGEEAITISGVPIVRIAGPQANATFLDGVEVFIQASVSNAGADISRVEVSVDNVVISTLATPNQADAPTFSITQPWTAEGAGPHVLSVTAFRADGNSSAPQSVTINVIDASSRATETAAAQPTARTSSGGNNTAGGANSGNSGSTAAPTTPPQPTDEPEPTEVPASATPDVPMALVNPNASAGINVRSGPGTNFNSLGTLASGATAEMLGINLTREWYKIRFGPGEGWVFAQLITPQGDISGFTPEAGPATPVPPPPTAVPATAVPLATVPVATVAPASNVNLVFVGQITMSPNPATCNVGFTVTITVQNVGTSQSGTATILAEDVHRATGTVTTSSLGTLLLPAGGLASGQTHTVTWPATVGTYYGEDHFIRVKIDSGSQVPETSETDNEQQIPYNLARGAC
ncbi:MAG: SH3 domain-containing protein [Chitinophagaceae bacterium]|nr:SH3 domain-containing protein [Anaerolineae bacterium]